MADNISAMPYVPAAAGRRHAVAAFAHVAARRRQWSLLGHHPTPGRRVAAQPFAPHSRFDTRVSRDASLRRLDRSAADDWRDGGHLESEDDSDRESLARLSEVDCRDADLQPGCRRGVVGWVLS